MNVYKLHIAADLPDDAVTARQFPQAVAVDEVHARKIDQELLAAVAGEDVDEVAQLSAAVTQREPSHHIHYNNVIELSGGNLETHSLQRAFLLGSYVRMRRLSIQTRTVARRDCRMQTFVAI
jgi:hypothetical protein